MNNNFRVRALYQEKDKGWYLDIVPPLYMNGAVVIQDGTLYFPKAFSSKEEAYEMAKKYLAQIGINQEIINNKIDYE